MALAPCVRCRQPFYASCHDGSCVGALCPYCEYGDDERGGGGALSADANASEEVISIPVVGAEAQSRRVDVASVRVAHQAR